MPAQMLDLFFEEDFIILLERCDQLFDDLAVVSNKFFPVFVCSIFSSLDDFAEGVDEDCDGNVIWILVDRSRVDGSIAEIFHQKTVFFCKCFFCFFQNVEDIFFFVHVLLPINSFALGILKGNC